MHLIKSICSCLKASSENRIIPLSAPLALLLSLSGAAQSATVAYTDEAAYLTALAGLGFANTVSESFEDGDWVAARTVAQPSVTNLGITWSPLDIAPNAGLRTGDGDAHDGSYEMFTWEVINGLPSHSIPDGYTLTANGFPLYAVGGWFKAGTRANLDFVVDSDPVRVDFTGAESSLTSTWKFLGFIEDAPTLGFSSVEILQTDETGEETRIFFSDDFTLGAAVVPLPAALPLFGTGLMAMLGVLGRRGKRR